MMKVESYWIKGGIYPVVRLIITDDEGNILKHAQITIDDSIPQQTNEFSI